MLTDIVLPLYSSCVDTQSTFPVKAMIISLLGSLVLIAVSSWIIEYAYTRSAFGVTP